MWDTSVALAGDLGAGDSAIDSDRLRFFVVVEVEAEGVDLDFEGTSAGVSDCRMQSISESDRH